MNYGLFCEWPNPGIRKWKTLFEEGVEHIQYSEEVGFDYCLIAEHHFSNYGNSPAPLLQALHIGQRTRKLKIATGILVLPIWDPSVSLKKSPFWIIWSTDGSSAASAGDTSPTKWLGSGSRWTSPANAPWKPWTSW